MSQGLEVRKLICGVMGGGEHSFLEDNSKSSLHLNEDDIILNGGDGDDDDLCLTPSKQSLCGCFEEGGEGNFAGSCPSISLADDE